MQHIPTILIVDDHPKNVKLLEAHLSTTGFLTECAYDGEEALEKINKSNPDLIFLDVMMPKLDGFEVCRIVKENEKTRLIPIVMVTALDQVEDKVKGIEAGADDFLTKPVNRLELLARTKSLIKTKTLNDQVLNLQNILGALFKITTSNEKYKSRQELLTEFARKSAELTKAESVAITFKGKDDDSSYDVVADYNLSSEIWQQQNQEDVSAVSQVMKTGQPLVVNSQDSLSLERYGLYSGYIGVPLSNSKGAIHAFGVGDHQYAESVQFLQIIAQRLGYELHLLDLSKQLESDLSLRNQDLQKALGEIKTTNENLTQAQEDTIFRLAKAAEFRDDDTSDHLYRIGEYSYILARRLGLPDEYCDHIKLASIMHDVGKIGTPDAILLKKGKFTDEEFDIMKDHTIIGAKILADSSSEILRMSESIALSHHEKWNGQGYPKKMAGEDIPLEARIVAIADVFDALTTKRCYKDAFSIEESLAIMKRDAGSHFDPRIHDAFISVLDDILDVKKRFSDSLIFPLPM